MSNQENITPSFAKNVVKVNIESELKQSYLDYAMSVIVSRAIPDVRDGLKPVHRRVLYAMHELSNDWNKPYKKSARIVGDVMGKYHPHGDTPIYDSIVRMAQEFSMRHTLIDGQGNFGSVDGDAPAAMRYTEIRIAKIAHEMLYDLDKDTVNFNPNYDGADIEPEVLPSVLPNLLVNGGSGIAVGMATSIPPHNLNSVINASLALLKNSEITIDELISIVEAPDFPTGAYIFGLKDIIEGYKTGRGRVVIRSKTHFEELGGNREAIIIDELPYQVNKARLCEKIGELVRDKVIDGITELRDESDKDGTRVVIELRRNENANVILNNLFKLTQMQDSFGINMVALVNGQPRLLNLKNIIEEFIFHRREVVSRRTRFELNKAKDRGHMLEGLAIATSNVDAMIAIIKSSQNPQIAKEKLMSEPWKSELVVTMLQKVANQDVRPIGIDKKFGLIKGETYKLSDVQASAILDLKLQRLTALEQDKIIKEYHEIMDTIIDLLDILKRKERVDSIITIELEKLKEQFGEGRKSEIVKDAHDIDNEALIKPKDVVVTLSHTGYIKTQDADEYRTQRRGGRGKAAISMKEDDFIKSLFMAHTHDYILCFSTFGKLYWLKVYQLPEGNRNTRGKPIINLLNLQGNETITNILPVSEFSANKYVIMVTKHGVIKKVNLQLFSNPSQRGIIAISLDDNDELASVDITNGSQEILLFSDAGKTVRFNEDEVRSSGRVARGVRAMKLPNNAKVISMIVNGNATDYVLAVTENGFGKRTFVSEYRLTSRATQGVIAIGESARNGKLVNAILTTPKDEIMLITNNGVLIRTKASSIRATGRTAHGVKLIDLGKNEKLVDVTKVIETDFELENSSETDVTNEEQPQ